MTLLTASDLTANPVSANAREPQFSAAGARWRSGYAPDCKSKADATETYAVSDLPVSFPVLDSLEKSSRLLTDEEQEERIAEALDWPDDGKRLGFKAPPAGHLIYFVGGDSGPVKIGFTQQPMAERLKCLQTGSPIKLQVLAVWHATRINERALHKRFAAHRLHGEWFTRCPEIEAEIARLSSPIPDTLNAGGCE